MSTRPAAGMYPTSCRGDRARTLRPSRRRASARPRAAAAPGGRARAARRGCQATRPSGATRRNRRHSSALRHRIAAPGHRRSTSARPGRGRAPRRDVVATDRQDPRLLRRRSWSRRRDAADRMRVVVRGPPAASRYRQVECRSARSVRAPRGRSSRRPHDHADRVAPPGPLGRRSASCRRPQGAAVCPARTRRAIGRRSRMRDHGPSSCDQKRGRSGKGSRPPWTRSAP